MRVREILQRKGNEIVTIGVRKSVHDAICRLNERSIGALVVVGQNGDMEGIITERDVLRECGERCTRLEGPATDSHGPCPAMVEDAMSRDLIIGVPEDDLDYVMGVMTKYRVRHLPILDSGKLAGIISIGDVVNALVDESAFENRMLRDYIQT